MAKPFAPKSHHQYHQLLVVVSGTLVDCCADVLQNFHAVLKNVSGIVSNAYECEILLICYIG
jgi:hypothetical protein